MSSFSRLGLPFCVEKHKSISALLMVVHCMYIFKGVDLNPASLKRVMEVDFLICTGKTVGGRDYCI